MSMYDQQQQDNLQLVLFIASKLSFVKEIAVHSHNLTELAV